MILLKVHAIPLNNNSTESTEAEDLTDISRESEESSTTELITNARVSTTTSPQTTEEFKLDESQEGQDESEELTTESTTEEPAPSSAFHHNINHFLAIIPLLLISLFLKF